MAYLQLTRAGRRRSSPRSCKEPNLGVAVALVFVMWIFVNIVVLWKTASLNAPDVFTRKLLAFRRGEAQFWLNTTLVHLSIKKFCTLKHCDAPIHIAAPHALIVHLLCTYCACDSAAAGGRCSTPRRQKVALFDQLRVPKFNYASTPLLLLCTRTRALN